MATFKYPTGVLYSENTRRSRRRKTSHTVGYSLLAFISLILVTLLSGMEAKASYYIEWGDAAPNRCLETLEKAHLGTEGVIIHESMEQGMKGYIIYAGVMYRLRVGGAEIICEIAKVPNKKG